MNEDVQRQIGRYYICIGDDPGGPEQPGNECTAEAFYEGGFLDVSELPAGRYIYVFRKGLSSASDQLSFDLYEVRGYQTKNMIDPSV